MSRLKTALIMGCAALPILLLGAGILLYDLIHWATGREAMQ